MAKKSSFRDRVVADAKSHRSSGYGYLRIPQGVQIFNEEPDSKAFLDFIPYEVTDKNHPDRNDEKDIAIPGELWYKRPFKTHRNVGVINETLVCPTSVHKACPVCEHRQKRAKEGAEMEELRELNASRRCLYVVIPRGSKEYKEEPHIWDISNYCFQSILDTELKENEENGVFPDLEEGKTLRIRFSAEAIGKNKFAKADRIDFIDRKAIKEDVLDDVPNLDECLTVLAYEQVSSKFFEIEDGKHTESEEKEEKEETPRRKARAKEEEEEGEKPRRRRGEEEEDEKETRRSRKAKEEEEEEEEEEEKPRSRKAKVEEEEEEEEEKPRPRKAGNGDGRDDCPAGYRFGLDNDKFKECQRCKVWEKCVDAKEAMQKEARR